MLEDALGNAYEGLIIVDPEGRILKINKAYAEFLGKPVEALVGRHVTEVVENTRMHIVARTGVPEIAHVQKIRGHEMICNRIPIFEQGKLVAVVGTIQFQDIDDLFAMTGRFRNLKKELDYYKTELNKQLGARYSFEQIVGQDEQLERVKELARKVARSDTTVLLVGESGTGKELFAHAIHVESGRALRPFLKVNCAAIPAELFESELFGYKEGAFTGARARGKKGKFSLADGGTLFLDEISELPLAMQAKLLRVLQEREVEPVGADQPEAIDVRIVAATNRRLEPLLEQGSVPARPLLPAQRGAARDPAAAGAARRPAAAHRADPAPAGARDRGAGGGAGRRRRRRAAQPPLARQRARAAQRAGAGALREERERRHPGRPAAGPGHQRRRRAPRRRQPEGPAAGLGAGDPAAGAQGGERRPDGGRGAARNQPVVRLRQARAARARRAGGAARSPDSRTPTSK